NRKDQILVLVYEGRPCFLTSEQTLLNQNLIFPRTFERMQARRVCPHLKSRGHAGPANEKLFHIPKSVVAKDGGVEISNPVFRANQDMWTHQENGRQILPSELLNSIINALSFHIIQCR